MIAVAVWRIEHPGDHRYADAVVLSRRLIAELKTLNSPMIHEFETLCSHIAADNSLDVDVSRIGAAYRDHLGFLAFPNNAEAYLKHADWVGPKPYARADWALRRRITMTNSVFGP